MGKLILTTFNWVPEPPRGYVRDLRARWALEEAGLSYEEQLLDFGNGKSGSYRKLQPFGQVPAYQEDGLVLFESGAVVLHVAERSTALLPSSTTPSVATFSPGRTTNRSPTLSCSIGTRRSLPSAARTATSLAPSASNAVSAAPAWRLARASK